MLFDFKKIIKICFVNNTNFYYYSINNFRMLYVDLFQFFFCYCSAIYLLWIRRYFSYLLFFNLELCSWNIFIKKKKNLSFRAKSSNQSEDHILIMWAVAFYIVENYQEEISDEDFSQKVYQVLYILISVLNSEFDFITIHY